MLRDIRCLLWVALLVVLAPGGICQVEFHEPGARREFQVDMSWWGPEQGLPQHSVTSIAQTLDGYLWIGTFGGLVRFDGVRMSTYDLRNAPGLGGNRITTLLAASDGSLWIGTEFSGVSRYIDGRFERMLELSDDVVWQLREAPDGVIWVCHSQLSLWQDGAFTRRELNLRDGSFKVRDVRPLPNGDLAVAGFEGVMQVDEERSTHQLKGSVTTLFADRGGSTWALGGSFSLMGPDGVRKYARDPSKPLNISCALTTRKGLTWVGTDTGLYLWENAPTEAGTAPESVQLSRVLESSGLDFRRELIEVSAMIEDREGNLWVGTERSGLCRVQINENVVDINLERGVSESIQLDSGRTLLTFGTTRLFTLLPDGNSQSLGPFPASSSGIFTDVEYDELGRLWAVRGNTLCRFEGDELIPVEGCYGTSILPGRGGRIWTADGDTLYEYDGESLITHPLEVSSSGFREPIAETTDGSIWLRSSEKLERWHGGAIVESLDTQAHGLPRLRSFLLDEHDTLWITSYGAGLFRLRGGELDSLDTRHGLHDDSLGHIFLEPDGTFWINSNQGVFSVPRQELSDCLDGLRPDVHCLSLNTPEGNGGGGHRAPDGRLWFPTIYGLVGVRPERTRNELPPPIVIEDIVAGGEHFSPSPTVEIPPGDGSLDISFSALSFVDPKQVRARYRLLGHSDEWIELGDRREIFFTNLDPGSYELELNACNNDGVWSTSGIRQRVHLQAHYFQTWWFTALIVGALLLSIFGIHRLRVAGVEAHNRELNQEVDSRRRTELALRESEESYRAVAETATDGIVVVDGGLRIEYANLAAQEMFGFELERCRGQALTNWLESREPEAEGTAEDSTASGSPGLLAQLVAGSPGGRAELSGRHSSGKPFPLEVSSGRMQHANDSISLVCIFRDVSERQQLERQLSERNKLEAIGRLAGGVAHDFNNILTALVGHAELLSCEVESNDVPSSLGLHVEQIQRGSNRASDLVQQLMTFAHKRVVERTAVDPNAVIADLMPMLERLIETSVTIDLDLASELGCIMMDASQFEQVIVNLVVNARDAIDGQGAIRITTHKLHISGAETVQITVSDTGCGMNEEELSKIFEPFFTTKPVGKGTGMGLATVHGIVEQSGGSIRVESQPGEGCSFIVNFPWLEATLAAAPAPLPEAEQASSLSPEQIPSTNSTGQTILLCDDNDGARKVAEAVLANRGYHMLVAGDPRTALRLAREYEGTIDALVTDVVMPDMDGPALAKILVEELPGLRVLFISGYVAESSGLDELNEQSDFLGKPFLPRDLVEKVQALLVGSPL